MILLFKLVEAMQIVVVKQALFDVWRLVLGPGAELTGAKLPWDSLKKYIINIQTERYLVMAASFLNACQRTAWLHKQKTTAMSAKQLSSDMLDQSKSKTWMDLRNSSSGNITATRVHSILRQ